jgi:hypothetical protein
VPIPDGQPRVRSSPTCLVSLYPRLQCRFRAGIDADRGNFLGGCELQVQGTVKYNQVTAYRAVKVQGMAAVRHDSITVAFTMQGHKRFQNLLSIELLQAIPQDTLRRVRPVSPWSIQSMLLISRFYRWSMPKSQNPWVQIRRRLFNAPQSKRHKIKTKFR